MGSDIRLYAEEKRNGKWECLNTYSVNPSYDRFTGDPYFIDRFYGETRCYTLFIILCGVRQDYHPKVVRIDDPRGYPKDLSEVLRAVIDESDNNCGSYLSLNELMNYDWEPYSSNCSEFIEEVMDKLCSMAHESGKPYSDYRIVFDFC